MVVISDTTTITNLIRIDLLFILPELYGEIIIPKAVYDELSKFGNQKEIIDDSPWIEIVQITNSELLGNFAGKIDKGEAEAIVLAIELSPDYLIIDELKGRSIAKAYEIKIIGLLGVLVLAKKQGLIENVGKHLERLRDEIGFRISEELYEIILKESGEEY